MANTLTKPQQGRISKQLQNALTDEELAFRVTSSWEPNFEVTIEDRKIVVSSADRSITIDDEEVPGPFSGPGFVHRMVAAIVAAIDNLNLDIEPEPKPKPKPEPESASEPKSASEPDPKAAPASPPARSVSLLSSSMKKHPQVEQNGTPMISKTSS